MSAAKPMSATARERVYRKQGGPSLTVAQQRQIRKTRLRAFARMKHLARAKHEASA